MSLCLGGRFATLDREIYFEDDNRTDYTKRMYMLECWYASHFNGYITTCFSPCPFPECIHFIDKRKSGLRNLIGILERKGPGYREKVLNILGQNCGKELCKI